MGQKFASVDAAPMEGVIGETVGLVPGHFLAHEIRASGEAGDLRQRSRTAEYIRQPQVLHFDSELIPEEILAIEKLADQRFAARQIAVGFNPHSSEQFPAAGAHIKKN